MDFELTVPDLYNPCTLGPPYNEFGYNEHLTIFFLNRNTFNCHQDLISLVKTNTAYNEYIFMN